MSDTPNLNPTGPQDFSDGTLVPTIDYVQTSEGTVVNVLGTLASYERARMPEVEMRIFRPGDLLSVDHDDGTSREFLIVDTKFDDLAFGTDSLRSPDVGAEEILDGTDQKHSVSLVGSCILPNGNMLGAGNIVAGRYLVTIDEFGRSVSPGTVTSFNLKRKDDSGDFRDVPLNRTEKVEMTESYGKVLDEFSKLKSAIEVTDYVFKANSRSFSATTDKELVTAGQQGFGCGVDPQYEMFCFDVEEQVIRAIRYIESTGSLQLAIMEGVTSEAFKDASFTRDWQETRMLEPSYLYRLTDYTDFVTYTWPNKATEQPVVTVVTDSVRFDEEYKPKQPDGSAYKHEAITSLVVDPTSGAVKGVKNTNNYWIDNPSAYLGKVAGDSEVADQGENYLLKTAGIEVRIPKTPLDIAKKIRTKTQNVLGLHR